MKLIQETWNAKEGGEDMVVDVKEMKNFINERGIKQKAIAEKAGLEESKLCMSLQGKRELKAGEYAGICKVLNVAMTKFVK